MVRTLLIRGMLVGLLAGLLTFGFSKVFGEPSVDRAIALEIQLQEAKAKADVAMGKPAAPDEPELVSRPVQAGIGLFTGVMVYCTAFGGLFALVFAAASGRVGGLGPRELSALLAAVGFIAVCLVPSLKYPANPPSVGEADTIGIRTALYFITMLISIAAITGAAMLRERLAAMHGNWAANLIALTGYLIVVVLAQFLLPTINEVPDGFPAVLLWQFRLASLGTQAVMWATFGLAFGWLTERARQSRTAVARSHAANSATV
jgi:predicted cobalt transporter CbtA